MAKKYIIEKDDNESIWSIYADANGDATIEGVSLTPYTEPEPLAEVTADAYQRGYETAKHECEDCTKNVDLNAIRKEAYEQGRKDGKIEGQAETWVCVKKIAFKPEIVECVDDLVRMGFDVGTADSWSEAIELLFDKYSASEVIEKVRQYEQRQEEQIQVGDEVTPRETEYDDMIVTRLWKDDYDSDCIDAIGFDGRTGSFLVSRVSKTGKHYEIAEVLQKMKEK